MNNKNKSIQITALLTIAVLAFGTTQFALAKDGDMKNQADLSEILHGLGSGEAKTEERSDRTKISIEIEDVPGPCINYVAFIGEEQVPGDFVTDFETEDGLVQCDLDFDDRNDGVAPSSLTGLVNVTGNGITLTGTL